MPTETSQLFAAAIEAINADIAATEARLVDLRQKRKATEELKAYFDASVVPTMPTAPGNPVIYELPVRVGGKGWGENSHHAIIRRLIANHGLVDFHTRDIAKLSDEQGLGFSLRQVGNALSRLRYDGWLESVPSRGKGQWHVAGSENTDGPAETGPSDKASPPLAPEGEG